MSNERKTSNDSAWWILVIVLGGVLWSTWSPAPTNAGQVQLGAVMAQPAAVQPAPAPLLAQPVAPPPAPAPRAQTQPAAVPPTDCVAAVRTVPPGWEEGLGGPTPVCWDWWDEAQRLEFLNYVKEQAAR
jgi:hypothetical protein